MVTRRSDPARRSRDGTRSPIDVALFGTGLALGLLVGTVVGTTTGSLGLWIVVGAGVGTGLGAVLVGARPRLRRR